MPTKIISKLARIWPTFFKLLSNKKDELYNIKKMDKWYIPNQPLRMLDVIRILLNEKLRWTFCSQMIDIFYQIRYKSVLDEDWRWYGGEVYLCGMA